MNEKYNNKDLPDETMSVAAGAAVPGALAVLAGTGEPNVVVTHLERRI